MAASDLDFGLTVAGAKHDYATDLAAANYDYTTNRADALLAAYDELDQNDVSA